MLGLAGIVLLFWHDLLAQHLSSQLLTGVGLCLLGTYGFSLGNMLSLRHQRCGLDVLSTNSWAMCYMALLIGGLAFVQGENFALSFTSRYLGSLFYLAWVGSVLGFGAYFTLVKRIGVGQAAYSTLLFPIVALTISTWLENYRWSTYSVISLLVILWGNGILFARLPAILGRWRTSNLGKRNQQ